MDSKHTPGPWRSIIDDSGGQWSGWPLCVVAVDDPDRDVVRPGGQWPYDWGPATSQREAVANARLIAAAPDLLEALQRALPYVEDASDSAALVDQEFIRAAICKATGQ
jgi:hypothetical protein